MRRVTWYMVVIKMASFVQSHLQKIKPSAKNVIEKYKEVFEQAQKELKTPEQFRQGLETFLTASEDTKIHIHIYSIIQGTHLEIKKELQ